MGAGWEPREGDGSQPDTMDDMARAADDLPPDVVVVLNPEDHVTAEAFAAWLDRRRGDDPVDPGVSASTTLAEARAAGEV